MRLAQTGEDPKAQAVMELTSAMMHRHYCENDVEGVIAPMDEDIIWVGAGENEYASGGETVAEIFRRFAGQIPKCNIYDEEYETLQISPDVYLCSGRMWIETDASTQISLRVHQRITAVFRWKDGRFRCCHIHSSNPYQEMAEGDVGFPTQMAQQSYQYLQEQVEKKKEQMDAQTEELQRLSYEDSLTGLYNRNKFNQILEEGQDIWTRLGVACFDLNGLKQVNDRLGHSAGDEVLRKVAEQIRLAFEGMAYRIGGDEFVVIDDTREEVAFRGAVQLVQSKMHKQKIDCSVGVCWRSAPCNLKEQFDEADQLMYQEKRRFYGLLQSDRRQQ